MAETKPTTRIATSDARSITVRGKDLVDELIGRYSFTEILYFLITDRFPSAGQTRVLDACLVTLAEHGFTPSSLVARLIHDSVPGEAQVAMSAGLLAIGSVFVGTMEGCGRILRDGIAAGGDLDAYCRDVVAEHRAAKRALPGFGHPFHKPDDPRPPRLFAVAAEAGMAGNHIALLKRLNGEIDRAFGRHLTINATGAIGALLLEIDLPPEVMRGIAVVSRAGGLIGHLQEERRTRSARRIWQIVEDDIPYEDPDP
jgi:citrate synthase